MTASTVQSDLFNATCCWRAGVRVMSLTTCFLVMPFCVAQDSTSRVELLTGKKAQQSLQRSRSVTLQAVPLLDAITDLQNSLQYAIVLDHRIDPKRPITLVTGLVNSREVLRQLAAAADVDVTFSENFAVMGPAESVARLRTVLQLRRSEVRSLRTQLGSDKYRLCFDDVAAGWADLMQPERFVTEQIQLAKMTRYPSGQLPYDLWRAQQLPALDLTERLSVVLNQFDQTFQIDETGIVKIVPVEKDPTVQRRFRIPTDRRSAIEALLQQQKPAVDVKWSGSRMTLQGRVELIETVESLISNDAASKKKVSEGLKTQLFTMSIPAGSTISRVIESLKASGISIQIQGLDQRRRDQYLQTKVQMDADRMPGAQFFPALLQVDGGTVKVEEQSVLVQF